MLDAGRSYHVFRRLERERSRLINDPSPFIRQDFGAGSSGKKRNSSRSTIGQIARKSLSSPWQCAVLFRLAEFIEAKRILELGTSFGISTLYLAANQDRQVTAMEGDEGCIAMLRAIASRLHYQNIQLVCGPFERTLPMLSESDPVFDLVFLDGHHLEEPTIAYFHQIKPWLHENAVLVVDDIHWSSGMEKAWHRLKTMPAVTQSIDFFDFGILFFRKEFLEKQDHTIIRVKYKPWKRYF